MGHSGKREIGESCKIPPPASANRPPYAGNPDEIIRTPGSVCSWIPPRFFLPLPVALITLAPSWRSRVRRSRVLMLDIPRGNWNSSDKSR